MKKLFSLLFVVFIVLNGIFAATITPETAKQTAVNFFVQKSTIVTANGQRLKMQKAPSLKRVAENTVTENPQFYIFNREDSAGFVIVAADDRVVPILGYADSGSFDPNNIPPNAQKWFENYTQQIQYAITNDLPVSAEIDSMWVDLLDGRQKSSSSTQTVTPLIQTKWDQGSPYNNSCPRGSGLFVSRSVTGCVATAMAQVMNYWEYPITGTGFHSYNHDKYGTLNANFASTTYDWANMPNQLTSSSSSTQQTAVATLMYHCGVSVDMNYGISSEGGSGAYVISSASPVTHCTEYALKTYFGYKSSIQGLRKVYYSNSEWINLLKTELNANRPIVYAGFGDGGHCFVCDGYDNNNYFHFNWGWGGSYDGYFALDALNPGSGGIGGGSYSYNNGQQAVIGIEPADGSGPATANFDIRMHADLSTTQSRYWFGSTVTVTTEIENHGPDNFSGEITAAIFDSQGFFVDFSSIATISGLQPNYYATRTLTHSGGAPLIPGNYQVIVFYRVAGGSWTMVPNDYGIIFDEINLANFEVYYSSSIETNSAFTITGDVLRQNQSATVNVNVTNTGSSTFYGKYRVSLSNLDGSWAQTIQILNENNGLPNGYHYTGGNNFTGTITVEAGTYLMEIAYQENGSSSWYYCGSSNYPNPVYVIVETPPIPADIYETNNTQAQAYNLSLNFSNNSATKNTVGSNLHEGDNLDYYKVVLPRGYDYSVTARLHDSYNSANGETYTVDALFSTSLNNTNVWSETYDDVMPNDIIVENGGTLYFKVAPYFSGNSGTYLLDMQISRTTHTECIQKIEDFSNLNANTNTTYGDGQFVGNNGVTWNYVHCIDASGTANYPINGKSLLLRRTAENSKLYTNTISGGIKNFSCKFRKGYTGSSQRTLQLYINNELKGESQTIGGTNGEDATIYDFVVDNISVSGDFTMEIRLASSVTTNAQIVIDDIQWCSSNTTDIENIIVEEIKVYPNPAKSFINIDASQFNGNIEKIDLLTLNGQIITSTLGTNNSTNTIPISNLTDGLYFIRLYSSQGIITKKVIVKQ